MHVTLGIRRVLPLPDVRARLSTNGICIAPRLEDLALLNDGISIAPRLEGSGAASNKQEMRRCSRNLDRSRYLNRRHRSRRSSTSLPGYFTLGRRLAPPALGSTRLAFHPRDKHTGMCANPRRRPGFSTLPPVCPNGCATALLSDPCTSIATHLGIDEGTIQHCLPEHSHDAC